MNINSDYQDALDYVYSFINFSITRNLRYSEEKFNLERISRLMALLGNPHLNYDVIHIAGTKGKGSTCAMIASILQAAGYKVGFYSSPHMVDMRERLKIDDRDISEEGLVRLLDSIKPAITQVENISTFEIITGLAFKYFSEEQVDIAVIEVGMGGRLDATNIIEPIVSVITPISLDHTQILGNTIAKIAAEKAGIIKESIPVVVSNQPEDALAVITGIAREKKSTLINAREKYQWELKEHTIFGQEFVVYELEKNTGKHVYKLPLVGDHQLDNAVTALAAVNCLPSQYIVADEAKYDGLNHVHWPGRFEVISEHPLVIIDGAHNPDSFQKLSDTVKKYLPGQEITLIFGASEDKDIKKMIRIAKLFATDIIYTQADHPRALGEDEMTSKLGDSISGDLHFIKIEKIPQLMRQNSDKNYVAAGSIFIASAIKELLKGIYRE